jgi:hypothetical protein
MQVADQEPLMLVLRVDQRIRKGTEPCAKIAERRSRRPPAGDPEIDRRHRKAVRDQRIGETELVVVLEDARLHDDGAGCRSRLRGLVDQPHANAEAREPQCHDEAGRSGADNQYLRVARGFAHCSACFITSK